MGLLSRLFRPAYRFQPGELVNLVLAGRIARCDGVVVAHTRDGVLVDWPNGSYRWVSPCELVPLLPDPGFVPA